MPHEEGCTSIIAHEVCATERTGRSTRNILYLVSGNGRACSKVFMYASFSMMMTRPPCNDSVMCDRRISYSAPDKPPSYISRPHTN